jgi:hypothetical protein
MSQIPNGREENRPSGHHLERQHRASVTSDVKHTGGAGPRDGDPERLATAWPEAGILGFFGPIHE